ncbi:MAG: STAS domain-containing protein [Myxococcales bacterium]|nr:STAS domain-containing protein [Myxococcales bacterium]
MAEPGDEADERLQRLVEVVALASVGEYAAARGRHGEVREDAFGVLEESLRIFVDELAAIAASREAALLAVTQAKAQLEQKLALIEEQQRAIRELSSPILDVWQDIVAVPLVGRIDRGAALALTEKLLAAAVGRRARWALIDITGVEAVDEETAACLTGLARALALVGARCVLTGVSPTAAGELAEHAGELRDVRCLADLREGLRHCLTQRR